MAHMGRAYPNNYSNGFGQNRLLKKRGPLFAALLFFYFAFHLISGERGLLAYAKLKSELSAKAQQREIVAEEKEQLANRVVGLRPQSLDLDLLEEVARKDLGYSDKAEVIYFWDN